LRWEVDRENPQQKGEDEFDLWLATVNVKNKFASLTPNLSHKGEETLFKSPPLRGGMKGRVNYINLFISFTINSEFDQTRKDERSDPKGITDV